MTGKIETIGLRDLIPDAERDVFPSEVWDTKPTAFPNGASTALLAGLNIDLVENVLASHPGTLRLGHSPDETGATFAPVAGPVDIDGLMRRVAQGASLVVDQADRYAPKIALICRSLAAELGCGVEADLTISPPQAHMPPQEPGPHNTLAVVCDGGAVWSVAPHRNDPSADDHRPEQNADTVVLAEARTGDVISMPRDWSHTISAGATGAIILTLKLAMPSWADLVGETDIPQDVPLRDLLPLGWSRLPDERLTVSLSKVWSGAPDLGSLAAMIDTFRSAQARCFVPDTKGRLRAVLHHRPVDLASVLTARPDVVWHIEQSQASVRLVCGPMTLDFPPYAGDALRYCMSASEFTAASVPGPLKPEERLALLNRLARNALLHRIS